MTLSYWLAAACGLLAVTATAMPAFGQGPIPDEYKQGGFFIGCQCWTWNQFTVEEAIQKTAQAGGRVIEFYPGQRFAADSPGVNWDHNATPEMIARVKGWLDQYHLKAVNYGVVDIPNNPAGARKVFDFAKALGLRAITTESIGSIDVFEPLVKEYNIMVGFHDHPKRPDDPSYRNWDPNFILSLVKDRDHRIGACADTGHWVRSGVRPIDALHILRGRIISSHLKDLNEFSPGAHDMPYGEGVSDVPAILDELRRQGFEGNISVEYEYEMDRSMPMVAQCIGYVRGYGQAKGYK